MSKAPDVIVQYQQQQAQATAQAVTFQRWSNALITVMVQEIERRLVNSDMPVDNTQTGADDTFWKTL